MQYKIDYTISVIITSADSDGKYSSTTYEISPSNSVINTPDCVIRLVGDFSPVSPPPTFDSTILFTPSRPSSNSIVLIGSPY